MTAVAGALLGFAGVLYNSNATQRANERNSAVQAAVANRDSRRADASVQIEDRAKILAANPRDVAAEIFQRLKSQSASPEERVIWDQGKQIADSPSAAAPASASGTVYVHYKDSADLAAVDAVIGALTKAGYYVPGKQKVVQKTDGDVRYFAGAQDAATESTARSIAVIVQDALASAGAAHIITTKNLHATFPGVARTTFEVWLPPLSNAAPQK